MILYERISNDEKETLRFMAMALLDDDTSSSSPDWTDANVELAVDVVLRLRLDLSGPCFAASKRLMTSSWCWI